MLRRMFAFVLLGVLAIGAATTLYGTANGIAPGSTLASLLGQGGEKGSDGDDD